MKLIGFYDYTVILTYTSLVSAICGIFLSASGHTHWAILCLIFSGFCDMFDGKVARSKKNRTDDEKSFGIQLDSLCDLISFGLHPALICFHLGMNGWIGTAILIIYCLCGLIRLAFFNVMEINRQKTECGSNKIYRGLPITSCSMTLPFVYGLQFLIPDNAFVIVLHIFMALLAFFFVLDIPVPKPSLARLFRKAK